MGAGFTADEVDYIAAWRRDDPRLQADAMKMWAEMGVLAPGVSPEARAKELVALAYHNGRLIGITTTTLHVYPPLRQRFAFMRMLMRPDVAESGVAVSLTIKFAEVMRLWSRANPEEQVAGFAALVPQGIYSGTTILPTGLTLVGYTDEGYQVRVFWWDHFRIPIQ